MMVFVNTYARCSLQRLNVVYSMNLNVIGRKVSQKRGEKERGREIAYELLFQEYACFS